MFSRINFERLLKFIRGTVAPIAFLLVAIANALVSLTLVLFIILLFFGANA